MAAARVVRVLKSDSLGRVERIEGEGEVRVRRLARGGRLPGSRWVARILLARERRALRALEGLAGVPRLVPAGELQELPGPDGRRPRAGEVLVRSWLSGEPLHRTTSLPEDFFDELSRLVGEMHRRGVCHNDLHKEQNVIVGEDGLPALIDFQLASTHPRRGRIFESRARDDRRHVQKHLRRYARHARGPSARIERAAAEPRMPRTGLARAWRRAAKPLYNWITRRLLSWRDAEERRDIADPWPTWGPPAGPRGPSPGPPGGNPPPPGSH